MKEESLPRVGASYIDEIKIGIYVTRYECVESRLFITD